MAKKVTETAAEVEYNGKVISLEISNFRAIGENSVFIEIDDIVVLVGPNNVGKSSILRAYEAIMHGQKKDGHLTIEDFHNKRVDSELLPTVIVETALESKEGVTDQWLFEIDGKIIVKEKFVWASPNEVPVIYGYLFNEDRWASESDKPARPFGNKNTSKSRRPEPIPVHAFQGPEKQAAEIAKVVKKILIEKAEHIVFEDGDEKSALNQVLELAENYKRVVAESSKLEVEKIAEDLTYFISKIFKNQRVEFDLNSETASIGLDTLFAGVGEIRMGVDDSMLPISHQGSGAQRTLLWAALKILRDIASEKTDSSRPNLLLIDEPELCLHPAAIREARDTLYDLAGTPNWQVMITTHSPVFIDFASKHTKVARVERVEGGKVRGTTIFRPNSDEFSEDDKENFKILNICDSYIAEFFFGGPVVLVEGDTE